MRTGNDRSVKTIRFLEQLANLCKKHDREISYVTTPDGSPTLQVTHSAVTAEGIAIIKNLPEA